MRGRALLATLVLAMVALAGSCTQDEEAPDRVLLVGDSLMNQVATPLRAMTGNQVDVRSEAVSGSGLLSPWLFDWQQRLPRVAGAYDPDVVVLLFIGNYRVGSDQAYTTADGRRIENRRTEAFFEAWQHEAERLTEAAAEEAGRVVWVLPPPMENRGDQRVAERLREIYRTIASGNGDVSTVDANDTLAGPDGGFQARSRGDGQQERLRSRDGVHLTRPGARRLAVQLEEAVAELT